MALPMLVNGADCGPVNPLQGLAKRFDRDRSIQQDQFGSQRAGSSKETFRTTPQLASPELQQEASRFFASDGPQGGFTSRAPSAFNFEAIRANIPSHSHAPSPHPQQSQHQQQQHHPTAWANDFLQHLQPNHHALHHHASTESRQDGVKGIQQAPPSLISGANMFASPMAGLGRANAMQWIPPLAQQRQSSDLTAAAVHTETALWDKEFRSQEASLNLARPVHVAQTRDIERETAVAGNKENPVVPGGEADELARTAGMLVESMKDEQSSKFKNSKFMGLMRQLRDGEVVVHENDMVPRSSVPADVKGKGKERAADLQFTSLSGQSLPGGLEPAATEALAQVHRRRKSVHFDGDEVGDLGKEEDPNEAYFRQENEEFIDYWNGNGPVQGVPVSSQSQEWGALQDDWDRFEAKAGGIRELPHYAFQPRNPYLKSGVELRDRSLHSNTQETFYDSVLELEAAVQRDPTNPHSWLELGIKQQENERESKAIVALRRALDLDPSQLPAWLALAISYTNENNRTAADHAIEQWVKHNPAYQDIYQKFYGAGLSPEVTSPVRKHSQLVECLMEMARSCAGDIDPDVQIALAVLLNASEEYEKAQDCFRTALAVRPEDWQLYNRVGATMANSGNADEALGYYYRALELNPAYIRARFNLGIACINMRKYEEAAQHILDALLLQDSDGAVIAPNDDKRGITSSALWESLKTTCLHLQRIDLAALCDKHDLEGLKREFGV